MRKKIVKIEINKDVILYKDGKAINAKLINLNIENNLRERNSTVYYTFDVSGEELFIKDEELPFIIKDF